MKPWEPDEQDDESDVIPDRDFYQEWSDRELILEHESNPESFDKIPPLCARYSMLDTFE